LKTVTMRENRTPINDLFGPRVALDLSWLGLSILVAWALATYYFPAQLVGRPAPQYWLMAWGAVLLLLASVLLHEMGHRVAALCYRERILPTRLLLFGELAEAHSQPASAEADFGVALAGPLANLALAALFVALRVVSPAATTMSVLARYTALVNGGLGIFNLLPGLPLDGGRVLRGFVWGTSHNYRRAALIAAWSGRVIALVLMITGLWFAAQGLIVVGLSVTLLGWLLQRTATLHIQRQKMLKVLDGHRVDEAMQRQFIVVAPSRNLEQLVRDDVLNRGARVFLVMAGSKLTGLLTLLDLENIPRSKWAWLKVGEVMTPTTSLKDIQPDTDLRVALEEMDRKGINGLPVMAGNEIQGVLTREDLLGLWQVLAVSTAIRKRR
jgi:Zn-dependent protease/CBS domain-containing protein